LSDIAIRSYCRTRLTKGFEEKCIMEGIILDEGYSSGVLSASAFNYNVQGAL
jgi:hypothetical protein